jgi:hypothetical protein
LCVSNVFLSLWCSFIFFPLPNRNVTSLWNCLYWIKNVL